MRTAVPTLAFAALFTLALTACGASEADPSPSPSAEREAAASPAPAASPTPSDGDDVEVVASDECLVGEWLLDNESWILATESMFDDDGANAIIWGEARMTLHADGTFTQVFDEWSVQATRPEASSTITRDGTDLGLWTLDGDVLALEDTEIGATMVNFMQTPEGSFEMDMTVSLEDSEVNSFRATCDGQTLTAETDEGTFDYLRQD